jgi:septal ring factor EnvC (AmiA/AmiB activator)
MPDMRDTLEYIAADRETRRAMKEEYWAAMDERFLKKQIENQSIQLAAKDNQLAAKDNKIAKLLQLLQQSGMPIPPELIQ